MNKKNESTLTLSLERGKIEKVFNTFQFFFFF